MIHILMKQISKIVSRFYSYFRLLSLDILVGVLSGAYFSTHIFKVYPSIFFWIVLCVTVWIIYTIDHILDGIRTRGKPAFISYKFHYKWRKILVVLCSVFAILNTILVFTFLEKELIHFGIVTFIFVLFYLLLNYTLRNSQKFFPKEIMISILYTWGIFGGIIVLRGGVIFFQIVVVLNYLLLVLANVLIYSYFDFEHDKSGDFSTFAVNFGRGKTRVLIFGVLTLASILSIFLGCYFKDWLVFIVFETMSMALFLIVVYSRQFEKNKLFGIFTDAVFFLPALPFLLK